MEQLIFELATPEPPMFGNFVAGANAEAVATLRRIAVGDDPETGVVVWGAHGVGKSHLLRAAVAEALAAGRSARYVADAAGGDGVPPPAPAFVAADNVAAPQPAAPGRLLQLSNA